MEGKINCEQFSYSEQRALTPMKAETVTAVAEATL